MRIHLFNPDHDLALASGQHNYMSPASARVFMHNLATLPYWLAEDGEGLWLEDEEHVDFVQRLNTGFDRHVHPITPTLLPEVEVDAILPWGWNPALCKHLAGKGFALWLLPAHTLLAKYRHFAHRQQAVRLLPSLRLNEHFCGRSVLLTDLPSCHAFVRSQIPCLLKAPLSGSGKGINRCRGVFTPSLEGWCKRLVHSQGGVVGEPLYDKVADFAMEFRWEQGQDLAFVGYSLFDTDAGGSYMGSTLASDADIEQRLSTWVEVQQLRYLRTELLQRLPQLLGDGYRGFLGVDMMICRFDTSPTYRIHPCVEINLRTNMGIVAHRLTERLLPPGGRGRFAIDFHPQLGEALARHRQLEAEHPLVLNANRVQSGYLALNPVNEDTRYRAWMLVEEADKAQRGDS